MQNCDFFVVGGVGQGRAEGWGGIGCNICVEVGENQSLLNSPLNVKWNGHSEIKNPLPTIHYVLHKGLKYFLFQEV